jgi:hypothetical protein
MDSGYSVTRQTYENRTSLDQDYHSFDAVLGKKKWMGLVLTLVPVC